MAVKKICFLGLGKTGVPLSAVIALKCPEIRVFVMKKNAEDVFKWNSGQIPPSMHIPGLEDVTRKCQNKNLFFIIYDGSVIKDSEIIFITSYSKLKTRGEGEGQAVDLSMIEEAAFLIAEHAVSNKIIVEISDIPCKTAECLSRVLKSYGKPGVEFQVLSNPEFYEQGKSLWNLLLPDYVLIGCDGTPEGPAAAKQLGNIYERWVPPKKLVTKSNWTVELSKIAGMALVAQQLSCFYAMASVFEEAGADVSVMVSVLSYKIRLGPGGLELSSHTGCFPKYLKNLIYLFECLDLNEAADYWRQVLDMFDFHKKRFFKEVVWIVNHIRNKKVVLLGYALYKDTQVTEGSAAVDVCEFFLQENAIVNVYDPKVTKLTVLQDLQTAGCRIREEKLQKLVTVHEDPYKATNGVEIIVVCGCWPGLAQLDFTRIFSEMVKPAFVFDRGNSLPHAKLLEIGFKVYAVGKRFKN